MKIAVVGANTQIGKKIVLKAESLGIEVINLVTTFNDVVGNGNIIVKDYDAITLNDVASCYCVVDPLSFLQIDKFSSDLLPLWHFLEILKDTNVNYLGLGSVATLYIDKSKSRFVIDENDVILDDRESKNQILCLNAYKRLLKCVNVKWSLLCPPLQLNDMAYGTGKFEFCDDILPVGINGDSSIAVNDFVSATIELLKCGLKLHKCVGVRGIN